MSKYSLNFAPLSLDGEAKVLTGRQPYDTDRLAELRANFGATHVFQRYVADDVILDVPIVTGAAPIGNVQEETDLAQDRRLRPALLAAALVRSFSGVRDLMSDRPVSVIGPVERGLLRHPELPEWIQRRTLLRFDTRTIHNGNKGTLGIICKTRLKNMIDAPCSALIESGLPVAGRYVLVREPAVDRRLMDRIRLVGRVVEVAREI